MLQQNTPAVKNISNQHLTPTPTPLPNKPNMFRASDVQFWNVELGSDDNRTVIYIYIYIYIINTGESE